MDNITDCGHGQIRVATHNNDPVLDQFRVESRAELLADLASLSDKLQVLSDYLRAADRHAEAQMVFAMAETARNRRREHLVCCACAGTGVRR